MARPFLRTKLGWVSTLTLLILLSGFWLEFMRPVQEAFIDFASLIWWALILGFLIGGVVEYWVPGSYIQKYLAQNRKRTVLYAVGFGFLASACSHGILAISMELYRKGASIPGVIAFLMASPWANLPITFLLLGFFGVKALFLIAGALVIAVITGLAYQWLEKKGWIEQQPVKNAIPLSFSIRTDLRRRWKSYHFTAENIAATGKGILHGSWMLVKMVLWWILIGMLLASVARAYIPHDFFAAYLGATIVGLLVTLILATIIEVCSEGSSPLAFEIYNQTGAFGNSFVFLMAGVATDYTEIGLIWSNIGKRAAIWLPIVTVPQILVLGYVFNLML